MKTAKILSVFLAIILICASLVSCGTKVVKTETDAKDTAAEEKKTSDAEAETEPEKEEETIEGKWVGEYKFEKCIQAAMNLSDASELGEDELLGLELLKGVHSSASLPITMTFEDGKVSMTVDKDDFEEEAKQYASDITKYILEDGGIYDIVEKTEGITKDEILAQMEAAGMTEEDFIESAKSSMDFDEFSQSIIDSFFSSTDTDSKGNTVFLDPIEYEVEDDKLFMGGDSSEYMTFIISNGILKFIETNAESDDEVANFGLELFQVINWKRAD